MPATHAPVLHRDRRKHSDPAFTRVELLAALAGVILLLTLALPVLASNRGRSLRLLCLNNLRQTGQALSQWGTEHGDRVPWRTPFCQGGTMPGFQGACPESPPPWLTAGININAWFQWSWMSNELSTPKILACPADGSKRAASSWDVSASGGFLHPSYRNQAVSYLAGLDVLPAVRAGDLLAGDRNLRFSVQNQSCSSGINGVPGLTYPLRNFAFESGLHVEGGSFLFLDGRVEELSVQGFSSQWNRIYESDNASAHYLTP